MNISISGGVLRATIDTYGGKIVGLTDGRREYIWQDTCCYWPDRAGILCPTSGRVYGGEMTYAGKRYAMPLHGFAYTSEMKLKHKSSSTLVLTLSGDGTDGIYPFPFELRVTYTVTGKCLNVDATVTNTGVGEMYYTMGFHPWLNVPIESGHEFSEYSVCFPKAGDVHKCVMSDGVLDTGKREEYALCGNGIKLRHSLFDNDALMLDGTNGEAVILKKDGGMALALRYTGMPYIGLWHLEKREVPFLCLEPMTALPGRDGVTEDWSERKDVYRLERGQSKTTGIEIEILGNTGV